MIILRNINQPKLCNGTRLSVKELMTNIIEAKILTGLFKVKDVLIPRIPMIPTDMSFQFKRLQFPIRLAFAITINKTEGQFLELCGLYLHTDCFSHGQLYVACSRVGNPEISLSAQKIELPKILCIHKYWKIKHIRNMHFLLLFPHLNKLSHSNGWPGTASIYIYISSTGTFFLLFTEKKWCEVIYLSLCIGLF